jgi:6-pyruvoyltetrahydropterin/6-carboxytetrahydropterin synthase
VNTCIAKSFDFCASHQLTHLPVEHPCARLHGHNYTIVLLFAGPVDVDTGFVVDFRAMDVFKAWVDTTLDHQHLNSVIAQLRGNRWESIGTTSENLAAWILTVWGREWPCLRGVRVSETAKTYAEAST